MAGGIVAAGHAITADAAASVLAKGGCAADAALAGILAACVAEPALVSLGGGGFLMAHDAASDDTALYDFFPDTPRRKRPVDQLDFRAVEADFGPARQEFHIGAGSAAAPSLIEGLFAVHASLGTLPFASLVAPAASAAREGVVMTPFQAWLLTVIAPILTATEASRRVFAPEGRLLEAGDRFVNRAFADAIEELAAQGPGLFVSGRGADAILDLMARGGHLTADDLAAMTTARRRPIELRYRRAKLWLNPPPAAGGTLIAFGLALLAALTDGAPGVLDCAAAMRATNDARALKADALDGLLDRETVMQQLAALRAAPLASRGTTHLSVIDGDGNAAAATVSNGEGSGLMVGDFGFMLNNMLGEEDLCPAGFNAWPEGVRLSSMMSPTIVRDAEGALIALGSGGSNRIRTAILQVAVNLIDRRMELEQAVSEARIHVEKGAVLSFEDDLPPEDRAALLAAWPDARAWPERNLFFGGVHAVKRSADGGLSGAGDPRRQGVVRLV
jgi:gamma-glutamyltranspeptidase/glutathione hydrolase